MLRGEHEVRFGVATDARHLVVRERAPHFRWHACHERPGRHDGAFEHDRTGGDKRLPTYQGAVEHGRTHADEAVVFDRAAVQHRVVPNAHAAAHDRGFAGVAVHGHVVLQVGTFAELDAVAVGAQHGSVEH